MKDVHLSLLLALACTAFALLISSGSLLPLYALSLLGIAIGIYAWPIAGIYAVVLSLLGGELLPLPLAGGIWISDALTALTVTLFFLRSFVKKDAITLGIAEYALMSFWGICTASLLAGAAMLTGHEFFSALLHLLRFIAYSSLFFVAKQHFGERHLITSFTALGTLLSLSGFWLLRIYYDFTQSGLAEKGWDPHIGRLTASWLDPNLLTGGLIICLGVLGAAVIRTPQRTTKVWLALCGGIILIAFLATYSRSGLVGLGITGLIIGLIGNRKLLIGMICIALLGMVGSDRLRERVVDMGTSVISLTDKESYKVVDPTADLRVKSWEEGWRIALTHPVLGVGFNAYSAHQTFSSTASNAKSGSDSSLLTILATSGVLGLGTFLLYIGSLLYTAWHKRSTITGLATIGVIPGLLLHSIFVNSLLFAPVMALFFLLGGALAGRQTKK